jgi:hypothetical protein
MRSISAYAFIISVILFSCTNSERINGVNKIELEFDSIVIEADTFSLTFYERFTINREEGLYIGYNSKLHSLDVFSLRDPMFIKREYLNRAGPSAVPPVMDLYCHNSDSIFLFCITQLILLDREFEVCSKHAPSRARGYVENSIGQLTVSSHVNLLYHSPSGTVLLGSNMFEDEVTKPIMAAYNLFMDTICYLPVFYPQEYFRNGGYGLLKEANYSSFNDTVLFYGFSFTSGVFTYNFKKGTSTYFPADPEIAPGAKILKTKDPGFPEMNNHALINPIYFEPLIASDHIFQIFQKGQPLSNKDGYNNFSDKRWHILIYSADGSFLKDIELPTIYYRNSWFVWEDNIYINPHPIRFGERDHDMTSLIFHRIVIR